MLPSSRRCVQSTRPHPPSPSSTFKYPRTLQHLSSSRRGCAASPHCRALAPALRSTWTLCCAARMCARVLSRAGSVPRHEDTARNAGLHERNARGRRRSRGSQRCSKFSRRSFAKSRLATSCPNVVFNACGQASLPHSRVLIRIQVVLPSRCARPLAALGRCHAVIQQH